jgi:hypothetical protein
MAIKQFIYPFYQERDGLYRPKIPVRITNPHDNVSTLQYALLDTGADSCVFPRHIAKHTNHNLKADGVLSDITFGVGSEEVKTWKHTFIISILSPNNFEKVIWEGKPKLIDCLDHDDIPPILGFSDFLCYFSIRFNYQRKQIFIEILP